MQMRGYSDSAMDCVRPVRLRESATLERPPSVKIGRMAGAITGQYCKWNSKHNRYCGGLLIRSPMDFGVQVQVLTVPPKEVTPV